MENVDYIIVGHGYAALFFAHRLIKNNKTFKLFSDGKDSASQISAGIINPVVLKRFTTFWKAQEQIHSLEETLMEMETYTKANSIIRNPINRIFHDEKEKELWIKKSEQNEDLKAFLNPEFSNLKLVRNPFGVGSVNQSARLDVSMFFKTMLNYLSNQGYLIKEKFNYEDLNPETCKYHQLRFQNIVFAEGMGVLENPYFSNIEVNPNKGHHLKVKLSEKLDTDATIKKKHFLFPTTENSHYYGGTYDREAPEPGIDEKAVTQLKNGLAEFYPFNFEIEEVHFGYRPTVKDRRPILGSHTKHRNLYVFNGLGARGILNGNYFAECLYQHIELGEPIPEEVQLERFH